MWCEMGQGGINGMLIMEGSDRMDRKAELSKEMFITSLAEVLVAPTSAAWSYHWNAQFLRKLKCQFHSSFNAKYLASVEFNWAKDQKSRGDLKKLVNILSVMKRNSAAGQRVLWLYCAEVISNVELYIMLMSTGNSNPINVLNHVAWRWGWSRLKYEWNFIETFLVTKEWILLTLMIPWLFLNCCC